LKKQVFPRFVSPLALGRLDEYVLVVFGKAPVLVVQLGSW